MRLLPRDGLRAGVVALGLPSGDFAICSLSLLLDHRAPRLRDRHDSCGEEIASSSLRSSSQRHEALWYNTRMTSDFDLRKPSPLLIVISGPSGAGKDTVMQRMQERGLPFHFVVTATTRPKRNNEVAGKDYIFVSKEEFARMIEHNELIEYAIVYGDYTGIPRAQVREALASGQDVVLRVDVQGAETVRKLAPQALLIFITTENEDELVRRLRDRQTESSDTLALRIATARKELQRIEAFDYVIVNHDFQLDATVDKVRAIIEAEHLRVEHRRVSL